MAAVAVEVGVEVAEVGIIVADAATIAETAATAADTALIVEESVQAELEISLATSLDTAISDELTSTISNTIEEDLSGELQQVVDQATADNTGASTVADSTAGEPGTTKPSMLKVIGKWVNRILNTYMIMDTVVQKIMSYIHHGTNTGATSLTSQDQATLSELSDAVSKMMIIYNSLKDSIKTISDSTDFLGNEMITENGTTASVKEIVDHILTIINEKITICNTILSRTPFTLSDVNSLGNAVYQVILRMSALFSLKAKSKVLTAFDVPTNNNRTTLNEILQLKFFTSRDAKVRKIQAIIDSPQTQAQAKTAAVSSASSLIKEDVVKATKQKTITTYQPEAQQKAKDAAKSAGQKEAMKYVPQYVSDSLIPIIGGLLAAKVKDQMKSAAKNAATAAADKAIKAFFGSPAVKAGIMNIAKMEAAKYASLKHQQILLAITNAVKHSIQATLQHSNL